MPISFKELASVPDLLGADRFTAFFPNLPGGGQGRELSLRNVEIGLPPFEVAQILVKILGWSINFAGRRVQQNSLTMGFYEDRKGTAHNILLTWQNECAAFIKAGGKLKIGYVTSIDIQVYDTTGVVALLFRINNAWPMRVTTPPLQDESSTLLRIEVDFSIDSVDYVAVTDTSEGTVYTDLPGVAASASDIGYKVRTSNEMPYKSIQVPNQLNLTAQSSYSLMTSFLQMDIAKSVNTARNNVLQLGRALGLG